MSGARADNDLKAAKEYLTCEKWNEAIASFQKFEKSTKERNSSDFYFQKSVKAAYDGDNYSAIEYTCRTLAVEPNHINARRNISVLLKRVKAFEDALDFAKAFVEEYPLCKFGQNTLGTILTEIGDHEKAIKAFKKALEIDPNYSHANLNLSNEFHIMANIDMAYIYMSKAIYSESNNAASWLDALTHFRRECDFDAIDKIDWWKVMEANQSLDISNTFLQVLTLTENANDGKKLLKIAKRCGQIHKRGDRTTREDLSEQGLLEAGDKEATRIGFISGDFRDHSVARFIWPLFEYVDRDKIELYCYSTYKANDTWEKRFRNAATKFRDVANLSPARLSNTIKKDKIDALFDLTGFTKGTRSSTFAHRSARAQISWLGFPGTTGLPEMDYLLVDKYLAPENTSSISEKLLVTAGSTVCFAGIDEVPITDTIPEVKRGYITFGSLNNSYKITRETIKRWSSVLGHLPMSKFLFVRREFQSYYLRKNILEEFAKNGIENERIFFYNNRLENRHYLDCYNEIDITLDTYPVTGGTTTTDALWMGVPVIALEGPHIHQRVCSAILNHAGHTEWIARTNTEFQNKAIALAKNQEIRIQLRRTLREEIKNSSLCDPKNFAQNFTKTVAEMLEI